MSSTLYVKRATYKPIDFFFRGVVDNKTQKVHFVDTFQMLNDRFLGRMSVCNYFVIAESSVRINELNIIALDDLLKYDLVMRQNFNIPKTVKYCLPITSRFLVTQKDFEVLIGALNDRGYTRANLVLSFDCSSLVELDEDSKKRYEKLQRLGFMICIYGFGEMYNSLDIFAEFKFDYLKIEAHYFFATQKRKAVLSMLVKFCKQNKVKLIMEGVNTPTQNSRYKREGIKLVSGKVVSKLSRWVTNEFLGLSELDDEGIKKYLNKNKREFLEADNVEDGIIEARIKTENARLIENAKSAKVKRSSPTPVIKKSPYQVRLEQQKKKALQTQEIRRKSSKYRYDKFEESEAGKELKEKELIAQMNSIEKNEISNILKDSQGSGDSVLSQIGGDVFNINTLKSNGIFVNETTDEKQQQSAEYLKSILEEKKKNLEIIKEQNLKESLAVQIDELNNLDDNLEKAFEEERNEGNETALKGHYNDKGNFVDEDGTEYYGYFDENGDWVEYEQFDAEHEGHYDEEGQWVDSDGNVYNGYFDDDGKFIDYIFEDEDGNIVDNGYFDETLKKWVPIGYFDENDEFIVY